MKGGLHRLRSVWLLPMLVLLAVFFYRCDKSARVDLVNIPDDNFLSGLIASGVDSDRDRQISYQEARATRSIVLPPSGISDLTGLEAFIHLDSFSITLNPLHSIDISANISLRYLSCTSCGNQLTKLDISNNAALLLVGFDNTPMLTEVCV